MNRLEFMSELEKLLSDISENEREEALNYYNDYLDDGGVENEEEVIRSLGSPKEVAATIKAGLFSGDEGAFTECGYQDYEEPNKNTVAVRTEEERREESDGFPAAGRRGDGSWRRAETSSYAPQKERVMERGADSSLHFVFPLFVSGCRRRSRVNYRNCSGYFRISHIRSGAYFFPVYCGGGLCFGIACYRRCFNRHWNRQAFYKSAGRSDVVWRRRMLRGNRFAVPCVNRMDCGNGHTCGNPRYC